MREKRTSPDIRSPLRRQGAENLAKGIALGLRQIRFRSLTVDVKQEDWHVLGRVIGDDPVSA